MAKFNVKDFDDVENHERFKDKRKANHDRRDREDQKSLRLPKPKRKFPRESKDHVG